MTNEQIQRIYNTKMKNIMLKNARVKQEQDDADRAAWEKTQATNAQISLGLTAANMYKDLTDWRRTQLLDIEYGVEGVDTLKTGALPTKYKFKKDRPFMEVLKDPLESLKRLTPKGGLEEREGYKQFKREEYIEETFESPEFLAEKEKFKQDALSWEARPEVPLAEELAVDEPIAYERLGQTEDVWTPPTAPAPLDMAALDESAKRSLHQKWVDEWVNSTSGWPTDSEGNELNVGDYEVWLKAVESEQVSPTHTAKVPVPLAQPDVPLDVEDEFYTPDLPAPAPQPDYTKIQTASDLAQEQQLGKTKRITEFDPMGDVDLGVSPELEGAPDIMMESPQLKGAEGAPITTTVPDAKPDGKYVGKTLGALKTGQDMLNIGKVLTNEEASDADKVIASTQGVKMLADLAAKKAGQETVSQIGSKAATQFIKGKGLQEGVKLGGKQAVGAAAGGVLGGYTMVTEAKEAKESWEEEDYDEAILHGIGAWSGSLQMGGAGMMATGIGAPLGAVLYGIGTAGSVISSAGLMLEGLFGGGGDAPVIPEAPKFNASRYLASLRGGYEY